LERHEAKVHCRDKRAQFIKQGQDVLELRVDKVKERKFLIAGAKARKIIAKGCQSYLIYLLNKPKDQCPLEDTAVVKKYQDVFSAELTSLPPSREVEFTINLTSGGPRRVEGTKRVIGEAIETGLYQAECHYREHQCCL
jgi:hypothetical protein